jgi:endoglucanase
MKKQLLIALLSIILFSLTKEVDAQIPFGVNLAGADFGTNFPGTYNVDYTYPTSVELDYYHDKGLNLIRLPIKWERIQPILNGNLNESELLRIKNFLLLAQNRNMNVIIDLHNYCRYHINGTDRIIGSNELSIANIKNLWTKLSLALNTYTNIWAYGIMNEPHDLLQNATWFDIAQEIIYGIRLNNLKTNILVAGDSYSSAERWMQYSNNLKNLTDPSNKLIFEAHVYFDKDASGLYVNDYDNEGAYPNIGVDRVAPFVNWLTINNLNGFIGEYGVPANDSRWLVVLNNFLSYIKSNCINGTYWAGGPWWGNYILSLEPALGVDKPQMNTLLNHLNTNASCSALNIEDKTLPLNQYHFSPNPFLDVINMIGIEDGECINIYDINGTLKNTRNVINGRIENLGHLKSGVYFLKYKGFLIYKMIK